MKRVKSKLNFLAIAAIAVTALAIGSCSKSSSGGGGTTPPPPVVETSDSVEPNNLVAYWPFEGNTNDVKGNLSGTPVGVTYGTGVIGQAYQGAAGAYATAIPGTALTGLTSYSLSVWYKLPAQPSGNPNDPGGMFFLFSQKSNQDMIVETEHYAPVSGDSVQIHAGFSNPAAKTYQGWNMTAFDTAAIGKWVNFVMTYDGPSSTYIVYQNGAPTQNSSTYGLALSTVLLDGPAGSAQLGPIDYSTDPPVQIVIGTWPAGLYGVSATLGANGSYLGMLDELRIWNKALSPTDVKNLYTYGSEGK